ncbi:MAG: ABC transporter permease, partial [Deltaproteobacteria bacterium]|nr:ABC transporter permease [Deltaproteobacteria bacterium]
SYLGITSCVRKDSPKYERADGSRGFCGLLQGDLGESYSHHESVAGVTGHRLPRTLLLASMAVLFELIIGLAAGVIAALRRNRWSDTIIMFATFVGISLPTYVTGPIALLLFAFLLGWFPFGGYGVDAADHIYHALLPSLILAIAGAATYARIMRGELIETLRHDHVRTAKAKGMPMAGVVIKHAIRNALLPVVTLIGLSLPFLVGGAIITEKIFAWPGLGLLTIESIESLDAPVIMAVVLMFGIAVQVGNLVADIAVAALDPRIRLDE